MTQRRLPYLLLAASGLLSAHSALASTTSYSGYGCQTYDLPDYNSSPPNGICPIVRDTSLDLSTISVVVAGGTTCSLLVGSPDETTTYTDSAENPPASSTSSYGDFSEIVFTDIANADYPYAALLCTSSTPGDGVIGYTVTED